VAAYAEDIIVAVSNQGALSLLHAIMNTTSPGA
jgi:hypothetical protein